MLAALSRRTPRERGSSSLPSRDVSVLSSRRDDAANAVAAKYNGRASVFSTGTTSVGGGSANSGISGSASDSSPLRRNIFHHSPISVISGQSIANNASLFSCADSSCSSSASLPLLSPPDTARLRPTRLSLRDASGGAVNVALIAPDGWTHGRPLDVSVEGYVILHPHCKARARILCRCEDPEMLEIDAAGGELSTALRAPLRGIPRLYAALWMTGAAAVRALRARTPRVVIAGPNGCHATLMEDGPLPSLSVTLTVAGGAVWRAAYRLRDHRFVVERPGAPALAAYVLGGGPAPSAACTLALAAAGIEVVSFSDLPLAARALLAVAMKALPKALDSARKFEIETDEKWLDDDGYAASDGAAAASAEAARFPLLIREAEPFLDQVTESLLLAAQ